MLPFISVVKNMRPAISVSVKVIFCEVLFLIFKMWSVGFGKTEMVWEYFISSMSVVRQLVSAV